MTDMRPSGGGKTRLTFSAPSRGLIGYHGEFLSDTRGTGIMNRLFERYGPYKGPIQGRQNGVLISMEQGKAVRLCAERAGGARRAVRLARRRPLRRHGHRRERQAPGPRGQPAQVQAADQLPRLRPQGRRPPPNPPAPDDAWSRPSPTSRTTSWSKSRPRWCGSASGILIRTKGSASPERRKRPKFRPRICGEGDHSCNDENGGGDMRRRPQMGGPAKGRLVHIPSNDRCAILDCSLAEFHSL